MKLKLQGDGPILLVDDSPEDTYILKRCFDRSQLADTYHLVDFDGPLPFLAHMDTVSDGTEPMPSVVMLDINMPVMNGFEALKTLRSHEIFQSIPAVVFVSNSDNPRDIDRANELEAHFTEKFSTPQEGVDYFNSLMP